MWKYDVKPKEIVGRFLEAKTKKDRTAFFAMASEEIYLVRILTPGNLHREKEFEISEQTPFNLEVIFPTQTTRADLTI